VQALKAQPDPTKVALNAYAASRRAVADLIVEQANPSDFNLTSNSAPSREFSGPLVMDNSQNRNVLVASIGQYQTKTLGELAREDYVEACRYSVHVLFVGISWLGECPAGSGDD
jgi:hypothetical protein